MPHIITRRQTDRISFGLNSSNMQHAFLLGLRGGWARLSKTIILPPCVPATDLGSVHKTYPATSAVSPKRAPKIRRPRCVWDYFVLVILNYEISPRNPGYAWLPHDTVKRLTLENCTSATNIGPDISVLTVLAQLTRPGALIVHPTAIPTNRHECACSRPSDRTAPSAQPYVADF